MAARLHLIVGMKTIDEVMTRRPVVIRQSAPVRAALAAMMELEVRHLPVVNEDHELVGMVSDRDLRALPHTLVEVNALVGAPRVPEGPVSSIMSTDVASVAPDDDLSEAIELMLESRVGAVPVVNPEGRLVGIVSYVDVLRTYHGELTS